MNKNGKEDAIVPISVEPRNDPPTINAPKFIYLTVKERSEGFQIYNRQRDVYEFSIMDVDLYKFPGNKSDFTVIVSIEVNDGTLLTTLPVDVITSAELKVKNGYQWQPLQTFVTISNFFVLEGQGIRFHGTIADCNHATQRLYFQGSDNDAVLTVAVNDMGNHGCFSDCSKTESLPFYTEVKVNLVRRRPLSPKITLLLGSAMIIEIVMLLLLGGMLLFFICKCMNALQSERRDSTSKISPGRKS